MAHSTLSNDSVQGLEDTAALPHSINLGSGSDPHRHSRHSDWRFPHGDTRWCPTKRGLLMAVCGVDLLASKTGSENYKFTKAVNTAQLLFSTFAEMPKHMPLAASFSVRRHSAAYQYKVLKISAGRNVESLHFFRDRFLDIFF